MLESVGAGDICAVWLIWARSTGCERTAVSPRGARRAQCATASQGDGDGRQASQWQARRVASRRTYLCAVHEVHAANFVLNFEAFIRARDRGVPVLPGWHRRVRCTYVHM